MRLRSAETYWLLKNGLIRPYPSLTHDFSCDVLVVGAGITGALIGYQLAGEGYNTAVIDGRDVAMGSTSASTAVLQYEVDEPLYKLMETVGTKTAVDVYQEGILAIRRLSAIVKKQQLDVGMARKKSLYLAHSEKDREWLHKEYLARKANKIKVDWLTGARLKSDFGINGFGAILSAEAGSVDPYKLTHALLDLSQKKFGLEVYDHTALKKIEYGPNRNTVTTTTGRTISAGKVIFATGYESKEFLKENLVKLISTYVFISEPMRKIPDVLKKMLIWDTQDPYLYMRATEDNRILVGGADESFRNPEKRDKLIEEKEVELMKAFVGVLSGIDIISDFSWAGTFGVTKDALPYIGPHPDFPNCYFILGFGGNGITFSVMGMQIISNALKGKNDPFLDYFRFGR